MSVNITEESLQKSLDAAEKRLEDLEKRYNTAIDGYQYCLSKDIDVEKANIELLKEKIEEIRHDKVESLKEFDKINYIKNNYDKVFCSLNNFESFVIMALHALHLENMTILEHLIQDEQSANSMIKMYDKMFYEQVRTDLGIKI